MLFDGASKLIVLDPRVCIHTNSVYWSLKVTQPSRTAFQENWKWMRTLSIEAWVLGLSPKLPGVKGENMSWRSQWKLQVPMASANLCASTSGVFPNLLKLKHWTGFLPLFRALSPKHPGGARGPKVLYFLTPLAWGHCVGHPKPWPSFLWKVRSQEPPLQSKGLKQVQKC